jgi:hypothetical protein
MRNVHRFCKYQEDSRKQIYTTKSNKHTSLDSGPQHLHHQAALDLAALQGRSACQDSTERTTHPIGMRILPCMI